MPLQSYIHGMQRTEGDSMEDLTATEGRMIASMEVTVTGETIEIGRVEGTETERTEDIIEMTGIILMIGTTEDEEMDFSDQMRE